MLKSNVILFLLVTLIFVSCKKDNEEVNFHHEYFPLVEGTFVEYQVTETEYIASNPTSKTYKLKTVVGDTVIDNSGRIARKFYRYIYDENLQTYVVKDLWTAIIDQERAELVEENQRMIKLVFAPTLAKEWDGNAFNVYEEAFLYYDKIHKPYKVGNMDFDSTLVVEEDSTLNFIEYRRKYEVYAAGIGLVKKHYQDYQITNSNYLNPITGKDFFYEVISFGVE
ncbi:MAG: hypothetical protein ACK5B9_04170 [Flavobacteriia bacterium]|jgi:hypothetical protein